MKEGERAKTSSPFIILEQAQQCGGGVEKRGVGGHEDEGSWWEMSVN